MTTLTELARRYHALERTDRGDFQRRARILQSMWRAERGYPIGAHAARGGTRRLGSRLPMPWAEETLANFLSEHTRQVVRAEVLDRVASRGKVYARPRIFDDLLSSQPLCFNLFAELQQDLDLASRVLSRLSGTRMVQVTAIEFEYSPGRGEEQYTGDRSAFDVYVEALTGDGKRAFAGIEVKYHENLGGRPARHRSRYDEIAAQMACFQPGCAARLRAQPLQQIWRDHLLAGSMRLSGAFADGCFVYLYPEGNLCCARAVAAYQRCLSSSDTFAAWTLEEVTSTIRQLTGPGWIDPFIDRYLGFHKIEAALQDSQ